MVSSEVEDVIPPEGVLVKLVVVLDVVVVAGG